MATEETPVTKESLGEKLGDLKLEEPEKFEDTTETPDEGTKEAVLEELTESPPKLHHVETEDTSVPSETEPTTDDGVVKAAVPEAFEDELKSDHDSVPEEKPAASVETVSKETTPVASREEPVEVTHQDVDTKPPSKAGSIGEKISATLHKIVGKD